MITVMSFRVHEMLGGCCVGSEVTASREALSSLELSLIGLESKEFENKKGKIRWI
jgi:hypothetical protein